MSETGLRARGRYLVGERREPRQWAGVLVIVAATAAVAPAQDEPGPSTR